MAHYGQRTFLYKSPYSDWEEDEYVNAYEGLSFLANNETLTNDMEGSKGSTHPEPNWHPEIDSEGNKILVAGTGDNFDTLKTYLSEIYGEESKISQSEWDDLESQINFLMENVEGGDIAGDAICSNNNTFDNLPGKSLMTKYWNEEYKWKVTEFRDSKTGQLLDNCSPTTFNRTDAALESVYRDDKLGKLIWGNDIYKRWQGISTDKDAVLWGTGIINDMQLGDLVDKEGIIAGKLKPGALLRLDQSPGTNGKKVSWHAAIFISYSYNNETGETTGMWYWHHWTYASGGLKGMYTGYSQWDFDNKGVYDSRGYKPVVGVNFR